MEQLGNGLETEESRLQFRNDFLEMDRIVEDANGKNRNESTNDFMPLKPLEISSPVEDLKLYTQQMQLSEILETSTDYNNAISLLQKSSLSNTDWNIEKWDHTMIETAVKIAKKWKEGFTTSLSQSS